MPNTQSKIAQMQLFKDVMLLYHQEKKNIVLTFTNPLQDRKLFILLTIYTKSMCSSEILVVENQYKTLKNGKMMRWKTEKKSCMIVEVKVTPMNIGKFRCLLYSYRSENTLMKVPASRELPKVCFIETFRQQLFNTTTVE